MCILIKNTILEHKNVKICLTHVKTTNYHKLIIKCMGNSVLTCFKMLVQFKMSCPVSICTRRLVVWPPTPGGLGLEFRGAIWQTRPTEDTFLSRPT